jgi:hypothetical protein
MGIKLPEASSDELLKAELPLISEYVHRYSKDFADPRTITDEVASLVCGADRLIDFAVLNEVDTIILLDKSARYVRPIVQERFEMRFPDQKPPNFCFINVGLEKQTAFGFEDAYLNNPDEIEALSRGLKPFIKPGARICIVDETASSGDSLRNAKDLFSKAFFDNNILATYAFDMEPFWTAYDELKDVIDPGEYADESVVSAPTFLFSAGKSHIEKDPKYASVRQQIPSAALEDVLSNKLRAELRKVAHMRPIASVQQENKSPHIPEVVDDDIRQEILDTKI